ncbi:MAG: hypothetical protein KF746_03195 [Chitinophagaceae bacterium]|nr:hypothetical protein [Chitinophagaceae bacterium]
MAGDKIDIFGKSYYFQNNTGGTGSNSAVPILDILTGLLGGPLGGTAAATHGGITASQLNGIGDVTSGISTLLTNQTTDAAGAPTVPKAYINYIFFDEQFNVVKDAGGNTIAGFSKVGSNSVVKTHTDLTNKTAPKNGYVYIYVSNESPVNVFFDNLQVIHTRGPILEETHYYPFGLTMAGISSKALNNTPTNRYKYNGIEHNNDFDLNMYDAFYRNLDPQIGRFWQIDPEAEMLEDYSPYISMHNNPISNTDPLGDFATQFGAWWHRLWNGGGKIEQNEYGEWSVQKSKTEISEDGGVTITSYNEYGKGRNKYTAAAEAIIRDEEIKRDIWKKGENSMYEIYDSPEEKGKAGLSYIGLAVPVALKVGTNTANVGNNVSKVLTRGERLSMLKEKLLNASMPKNPKEALKLINKTLDKIEKTHAGPNDRMYGILDNKYVTLNTDGSMTALTRGHRIEIQSNGSFSIFERSTGNLFLAK